MAVGIVMSVQHEVALSTDNALEVKEARNYSFIYQWTQHYSFSANGAFKLSYLHV